MIKLDTVPQSWGVTARTMDCMVKMLWPTTRAKVFAWGPNTRPLTLGCDGPSWAEASHEPRAGKFCSKLTWDKLGSTRQIISAETKLSKALPTRHGQELCVAVQCTDLQSKRLTWCHERSCCPSRPSSASWARRRCTWSWAQLHNEKSWQIHLPALSEKHWENRFEKRWASLEKSFCFKNRASVRAFKL